MIVEPESGIDVARGAMRRNLDVRARVVDPLKEMIISRSGFNVYPPEVEAAINSLSPLATISATIRALSSSLHFRRRPAP
ncbi:hypothetical protein [Bradyrhizobium yuanmingense]|uniref:hypothetical protein n=1 Tax=Bradyrhizobium yuanmingense TaxID=108015 RepID=UPI0023B96991|nr:hypothetical protein [Bradyrhizobium yuanmingense]MDF0498886.1 hypothetical protein [Bradyrhizobium yuanmingense]